MNRKEKIRIISSALIGNTLEWFDFAIYGYLTSLIAVQFFPSSNKMTSLLLTYSVFAIGFFARPLGALIFGYIGDKHGRKNALVLSSLTMAFPTFLIGCLPNYEAIGIAAPLLLVFLRILQGFSLGGEFTGSFVYLVEQGTKNKKGFFSCWADLGCSLGMITGTLCVALLHKYFSAEELLSYAWRIPFLSGILLSLLALYLRKALNETPEFMNMKKTESLPIKIILKEPKKLVFATLLLAISALGYYILIVFIPAQTVALGKLLPSYSYFINSFILTIILLSTFIAAYSCDYFDKIKLYMIGAAGCLLVSYPLFYSLKHLNLNLQLVFMCLMAISLGFCFGARPLCLVSMYPVAIRGSAIALAYNLGNAVFGGTSPLMASFLIEKTGSIEAPCLLVILAALLTLYALFSINRKTFQSTMAMQSLSSH